MTLRALSKRECLRDMWSLLEHAKCIGVSFSPLCIGALLMVCEQRRLFKHELALLKRLEGAAGNHAVEMSFRAAAKRVAVMRLAKTNEMKLPDSQ